MRRAAPSVVPTLALDWPCTESKEVIAGFTASEEIAKVKLE